MAKDLTFNILANDKFSSVMKKVGLAITAGVTAAAAATFFMTKSIAESDDAVGKFAGRIGVTTEKLSAYQHAAQLSGLENTQLNLSWQRMTRRIAEASEGMGEAQGALKELNLDAQELNTLSTDEQFLRVAESLDDVESQADKVRLAFKLFDSEGVGVLQMLENGSEGLREMTAEAERFGAVVSEEAAANAAQFNDNLMRLTSSVKGLGRDIANELMPEISDTAEIMTDVVAEFRDFMDAGGGLMGLGLDTWFEGLNVILHDIGDYLASGTIKANAEDAFESLKDETIARTVDATTLRLEIARLLDIKHHKVRWLSMEELLSLASASEEQLKAVVELEKSTRAAVAEPIAKGAGAATDENVKVVRQNFDEIIAMHDELFLTQSELEDIRFAEQQEKYEGNQQALDLITEIHAKKRDDIRQVELDAEVERNLEAQQFITEARTAAANSTVGLLNMIGRESEAAAVAGIVLGKALEIGRTIQAGATASVLAYASQLIPGDPTSLIRASAAAAKVKLFTGIQVGIIGATGALQLGNVGGAAHGGLENVPSEQTYLLNRGERVLSPGQNSDFTELISSLRKGTTASPQAGNNITYNFTIMAADFNDFVRQLAPFVKDAAQVDNIDFGLQVAI